MGALKTSEQGDVAGEGSQNPSSTDRPVDSGAKIIISAGPIATASSTLAPRAPRARSAQRPTTEPRRGGLGLVIALYVLSASALAYAIYERFVL